MKTVWILLLFAGIILQKAAPVESAGLFVKNVPKPTLSEAERQAINKKHKATEAINPVLQNEPEHKQNPNAPNKNESQLKDNKTVDAIATKMPKKSVGQQEIDKASTDLMKKILHEQHLQVPKRNGARAKSYAVLRYAIKRAAVRIEREIVRMKQQDEQERNVNKALLKREMNTFSDYLKDMIQYFMKSRKL